MDSVKIHFYCQQQKRYWTWTTFSLKYKEKYSDWNQNQKVTAIKFSNVINDVSTFAARAFLTGIQIPLIVGSLSLQVTGLVFNSTTFTVGVSSSSVIKSVSVSYILFPTSSQSFAFSAGTFAEENINGTFYQNAQGSLNSFNYYIYGITGFDL